MDGGGEKQGCVDASRGVLHVVRILIVEDMRVVSEGLERLLSRAGATTQVAATVEEAYRALAEHTFDIVLLDLNLNEQSGIPIAEAARDLPSPPIVLVVTGDLNYLDRSKLEGVGARVLMKMNLGAELVGFVRSVLDQARAGTVPPLSGTKVRPKGRPRKAGGVVELTSKEMVFLARLDAGQTLSIETVATEILGRRPENDGNATAVRKFVSRLREKLIARRVAFRDVHPEIECDYGDGYRIRRTG